MSPTVSSIQHVVSDAFLDNLSELARRDGSWWQDVLLRDDVFIAVRNNSLNVYHRGASIFRIDDNGRGKIRPWTHVKYLVKQQQLLAELMDDGRFKPNNIGWSHYESPNTLKDMIRSAADLSGVEKTELHPLVLGSSNVIDVEVSLLRPVDPESADDALPLSDQFQTAQESTRKQDRLDVVTLEDRPDGIFVVFHEAKHFSNAALRAKAEPSVIGQMRRYHKAIVHHEAALRKRYEAVCVALVRLHEMRIDARKAVPDPKPLADLNQMVRDVAAGKMPIQVDPDPRLVVFGFDANQKDGRWKNEKARLKEFLPGIKIKDVGNTKSAKDFF